MFFFSLSNKQKQKRKSKQTKDKLINKKYQTKLINKKYQTEQNETKNKKLPLPSKKPHGICFVLLLACYSLAYGLPWSVVDIYSDCPLEETGFPFLNRYQLQIVS